jgi:S-adenosylmethionine:tRNA ribosyltransferase-isomerase
MVKPGKRMREGHSLTIGGCTGAVTAVEPDGTRLIHFDAIPDEQKFGHLPLPHYMQRDDDTEDDERYQTVYAKEEGAIAAPTAGLHFTNEMLESISHAFLTLHVGVGTFRPVSAEVVTDHVMHSEKFIVTEETAKRVNTAGRVLAVGTTVTRVLEALGKQNPPPGMRIAPTHHAGETDIFIHPPHEFRAIDALLTNFHLPQSTLLMLVSALAGRELMLEAYREAVAQRYRFFSYGDCMLIL